MTGLFILFFASAVGATDTTEELNLEESLHGASQCGDIAGPQQFLNNIYACDFLGDTSSCSLIQTAAFAGAVQGMRKAESYLKSKAGQLSNRIRAAMINELGNSLHNTWKKGWAERVAGNPAELKVEKANLAKYQQDGLELVTNNQGNPPRYKIDKSVPGKFFDIGNLDFVDLPPAYANDNRRAAEEAVDHFFEVYKTHPEAIEFPKTEADLRDPIKKAKMDKMADAFHRQWLVANRDHLWVTGDPELENRLKDKANLPRSARLLKRHVSPQDWASLQQNRATMKKWETLNRPFSQLPPEIKKLNRDMVNELSVIFENKYVNRMGKTAAYLRAGMKTAGHKAISKAVLKWGAWKLAAYPLALMLDPINPDKTACAQRDESYMALDESCEPQFQIDTKVLDFLSKSGEEQTALLNEFPSLCEYYKNLAREVLKDKVHEMKKGMADNNTRCTNYGSFAIEDRARNEKIEFIHSPESEGHLEKLRISQLSGSSPYNFEVFTNKSGQQTVFAKRHEQTVASLSSQDVFFQRRPEFKTEGVFRAVDNKLKTAMADALTRARSAHVTNQQLGNCCKTNRQGRALAACIAENKRRIYSEN